MSRKKGTAAFAVNFEPSGQMPLDARLLVADMNELIAKFGEYMLTIRNYSNNTEVNYTYDLDCYSEYLSKNKINYKNINYKEINGYIKFLKEN